MKYIRVLFLSALLFVSACSKEESTATPEPSKKAAPEDVSEENVNNIEDKTLQEIVDKSSDVESYHTSLELNAELDEEDNETVNLDVDYIESNPPELSLTSHDVLRTISKDGKTYFYNNDEWVDITDSVEENALFSVTYQQVVNTLMTVKDEVTHEEKDGKHIYKYEGNNEHVYRAIERLIQINFGSVDVSQNETELEFIVKDKRIEKIEFDVEINDDEGTVNLSGESRFDQFNKIKEIEVPEELQ